MLQDTLTAIRERTTIHQAGFHLYANGERHLRSLEVLQHVSRGMTSKQIGHELFISENTVKNHIRNILDKLGLHSRSEAVLYAVREDLITLS